MAALMPVRKQEDLTLNEVAGICKVLNLDPQVSGKVIEKYLDGQPLHDPEATPDVAERPCPALGAESSCIGNGCGMVCDDNIF